MTVYDNIMRDKNGVYIQTDQFRIPLRKIPITEDSPRDQK